MEARQVKTTLSSLRNKTDRNDARGIAQILRTGWYREVHVKSLESQRLKTLLTARKALLRRRLDLENEVRGCSRSMAPGCRRSFTMPASTRWRVRPFAILYTLIETARFNGIDPEAWLADVIARIADHPISKIEELLPWTWSKATPQIGAA
jgi:transposase